MRLHRREICVLVFLLFRTRVRFALRTARASYHGIPEISGRRSSRDLGSAQNSRDRIAKCNTTPTKWKVENDFPAMHWHEETIKRSLIMQYRIDCLRPCPFVRSPKASLCSALTSPALQRVVGIIDTDSIARLAIHANPESAKSPSPVYATGCVELASVRFVPCANICSKQWIYIESWKIFMESDARKLRGGSSVLSNSWRVDSIGRSNCEGKISSFRVFRAVRADGGRSGKETEVWRWVSLGG